MSKLCIKGKPVVIWMETIGDVEMAGRILKNFEGYAVASSLMEVRAIALEGNVALYHGPFQNMVTLLKEGQPVLFCVERTGGLTMGNCNPLLFKIERLKKEYPGLISFGDSPTRPTGQRTVWAIPGHHMANAVEYGYTDYDPNGSVLM